MGQQVGIRANEWGHDRVELQVWLGDADPGRRFIGSLVIQRPEGSALQRDFTVALEDALGLGPTLQLVTYPVSEITPAAKERLKHELEAAMKSPHLLILDEGQTAMQIKPSLVLLGEEVDDVLMALADATEHLEWKMEEFHDYTEEDVAIMRNAIQRWQALADRLHRAIPKTAEIDEVIE